MEPSPREISKLERANHCQICQVPLDLPFVCSYCKGAHCNLHRLPENHDCPNLKEARPPLKETPLPLDEIPPYRIRGIRRRSGSRFGRGETVHLVAAWLVLAVAFSVGTGFRTPSRFLQEFTISLLIVGAGFVGHELAHKFAAQNFGYRAEFKSWTWGLIMALLFAVLTQGAFIFAAPGAVYIRPSTYTLGSFGVGDRRREGVISVWGPLLNLIMAVVFIALVIPPSMPELVKEIGYLGYRINLLLAAFNMLPFGPLDGRKIFDWSPIVWLSLMILPWILLFFPFGLGG